jgi:hypothetical protein
VVVGVYPELVLADVDGEVEFADALGRDRGESRRRSPAVFCAREVAFFDVELDAPVRPRG